jgi:hypothetical protein
MRYVLRPLSALAGAACLSALMTTPGLARPTQDAPATVVRAADADMTCAQMADEAATISAGMGENGPGLLGRVGGVARAGASLLVPGAGLAIAGADALTSSGKDRKEAEADAKRDRWNYLNGLYAGRGCGETATEMATAAGAASPTSATATAAPAIASPSPSPAVPSTSVAAPAIIPATFPH